MPSPLIPYILQSYAETKRCYPTEGRRKWKLRVAQQFWTTVGGATTGPLLGHDVSPELTSTAITELEIDPDPLDVVTGDAPELGLVVRTDFSDEPSWEAFCTRLQESEKELGPEIDEDAPKRSDGADSPGGQDESDDENEDDGLPPAVFHIINPSAPQEREILEDASNLTVLRLFNDVDVRPSPTPPPGVKRCDPPNRLVDYHGWQEFYQGKNVWVYDTKSNTDQCVRVVSQGGDMYGTATGDSWRARASHICELQVNLSFGAIRIDFGGLDRWDFNERRRNMLEAEEM